MKVSIILPIKNEANNISSTLDSIIANKIVLNQSEIIIVDGGSKDGTIEIIRGYSNKYNFIKILKNPDGIVSTGFNIGLNNSKGKVIFRIDGHCIITDDYIKRCLDILEKNEYDIVGGVIDTISYGKIGQAIAKAQSSWFGVGGVKFRNIKSNKSAFVDTLAFGAHKRELFLDIGGYDEEMVCNQDDEFNSRALQNGKKIWLEASIISKYISRSDFMSLFKQYFNYGYYKLRGIQKRKKVVALRHLIPVLFIMGLSSSIFIGYLLNNTILFYSVLSPYLLANIIFSLIFSFSIASIPLIFLSYTCIHIGYGLGFFTGLVRFITKWFDREIKDYHFDRNIFISNSTR